jgi:hypothetical protein
MLPLPDSLGCVRQTQPWYRIHHIRHGAIFFGKSGAYRFDDPEQKYGVFYAAEHIQGAVVETLYPAADPVARAPARVIAQSYVFERAVAPIFFERPLKLVDLTGSLARLGTIASAVTSLDRLTTQGMSRQFYGHPDQPDGILYCSQYDLAQRCIAVFEGRVAAQAWEGCLLADPLIRQFLDYARDYHGLRIDPTR